MIDRQRVALGAIFVYDIVLYADAVLFRRVSPELFAGRASVTHGAAMRAARSARSISAPRSAELGSSSRSRKTG